MEKKNIITICMILLFSLVLINVVNATSVNVLYWNDGGSYTDLTRTITTDDTISFLYHVSLLEYSGNEQDFPITMTLYREQDNQIREYFTYTNFQGNNITLNNQEFNFYPITDEITLNSADLEQGINHIILTSEDVQGYGTDSVMLTLNVEPGTSQTHLNLNEILIQTITESSLPQTIDLSAEYDSDEELAFSVSDNTCPDFVNLIIQESQLNTEAELLVDLANEIDNDVNCQVTIEVAENIEQGLQDSKTFDLNIINSNNDIENNILSIEGFEDFSLDPSEFKSFYLDSYTIYTDVDGVPLDFSSLIYDFVDSDGDCDDILIVALDLDLHVLEIMSFTNNSATCDFQILVQETDVIVNPQSDITDLIDVVVEADEEENNILFIDDFDDIVLNYSESIFLDLFDYTTYTDANGVALEDQQLIYYTVDSDGDCDGVLSFGITPAHSLEIWAEENTDATCDFQIVVEEVDSIFNPQSDITDLIDVVVEADEEENNILFIDDFDDIVLNYSESIFLDLFDYTTYTDANGVALEDQQLIYYTVDSDGDCDGVLSFGITPAHSLEIWAEENTDATCDFQIVVEEVDSIFNPQSDITNLINVVVEAIELESEELIVQEIFCDYEELAAGTQQHCAIYLTDNLNTPINDAVVQLFYSTNELITTDNSGQEGIYEFTFNAPIDEGDYTVYANAFHNTLDDYLETIPNFTFFVQDRVYSAENLRLYDSEEYFGQPIYDTIEFYREEQIYAEFQVVFENNGGEIVTDADFINSMSLMDDESVELLGFNMISFNENNQHYFRFVLDSAIPLTDNFLGDEFGLKFISNDNIEINNNRLTSILNNYPVWDDVDDVNVNLGQTITITNIDNLVSDIEDDFQNIPLILGTSLVTGNIQVEYDENNLIITPLAIGTGSVVLYAFDHNGAVSETTINVNINSYPVINAYFEYSPDLPRINEKVIFDATDSVGSALDYYWDFGDGTSLTIINNKIGSSISAKGKNSVSKIIHSDNSRGSLFQDFAEDEITPQDENVIIEHTYARADYYTVTLTITDEYGNEDTYSRVINVDTPADCSDGIDNDGDGLIDMDDPGCEHPGDPSEWNSNAGIEDGVVFNYITIYSECFDVCPGDDVFVSIKVTNNNDEDVENLRITLSSLELGEKIKSHQFDLDSEDSELIKMNFYVPYGTLPGEYPLKVTVSNDDLIHSRYRYFYIK